MHIIHSYLVKPFIRTPRADQANSTLKRAWKTWEESGQEAGQSRDIAVKRLEECLKRNASFLDLSNLGLTSLPEKLPPGVTSLNISENKLTQLPKNLPSQLETLVVSNNALASLPKDLPSRLKSLDASHNSLTSLPDRLPFTLISINVSYNQLSHLPEMLPFELISLDVSDNPLTHLPEKIPHTLRSLHVGSARLSQLPEKMPPQLDTLDVSDNQLTKLPKNLPPRLETLDIGANPLDQLPEQWPPRLSSLRASETRLTTLPETLPFTIKTLLVHYNRLTRLPANLPPSLKELSVNNNQLISLPESLPLMLFTLNAGNNRIGHLPVNLPPLLHTLDLANNRLSRLSAGLEMLPPRAYVNVSNNLFSVEELNRIAQIQNRAHYRGPRIIFSMASSIPVQPARALRESIANWRLHSVELWDKIEAEPGARAFSLFLDRLSHTVNYENTDFKNAVLAWLTKLAGEDRQALRSMTFQIAEEATQSCEDRVSLAYNEMKMLILADEVERGRYDEQIPELIEHARGLFRLESLYKIAREKANALNFVDEIEVYLAFQIKLRDTLSLPLDTPDMRFFDVSWVTEADLASAKERVECKEKEEFFHYLSTDWQPWQEVLKKLDPTHYNQARDSLQEAISAEFDRTLTTRLQAVGLVDDDDASRQLGTEVIRDIERDIMGQLTTAFLQRRGLELK